MKQAEIKRLLPGVFQRTLQTEHETVLGILLAVMEQMHAPSEAVLADLDSYFNPYRAPESFVPYLAGWMTLDALFSDSPGEYDASEPLEFPSGSGWLRELVAASAYLAQWRGTKTGLLAFLQIATGIQGFEIDEDLPGRQFHLRVRYPAAAAPYRALIDRIIRLEKPAYVTYELEALPAGSQS